MRKEIYDVTIIGGGPAGLFSAFYSGLRNMKTKILEYQPNLGGKIHVYPQKMIWDIGGLKPVSGKEVMDNMIFQALTFNPTIVCNEKATKIDKIEDLFEISGSSGDIHYSKTVIIAVGSGILQPHQLEIKGLETKNIHNLYYTVPSLEQFKNKTILISGGGNAAIDWANELEPIADKIYLVYRNKDLKGHEAQVKKLLSSSVECIFESHVENMDIEKDYIRAVKLKNTVNQELITFKVDAVIVNHGYIRDRSLFEHNKLNVDVDEHGFLNGTSLSETSVHGIYAAGDIITHKGKLNLIAGAFQDAALAVNQAKKYVDPNAKEKAMVSSHNERLFEKNKNILKQKKILG